MFFDLTKLRLPPLGKGIRIFPDCAEFLLKDFSDFNCKIPCPTRPYKKVFTIFPVGKLFMLF